MNINDKIIFRTCGRGIVRVWKGTIRHIVPAGKLPSKALRAMPHGDKPSNRDRFIVALNDKDGTLVWANATGPNIVAAGKKLPEHNPRIAKAKVVKPKLKPIAKDKSKVAKAVKKAFRAIDKKVQANVEPRGPLGDNGPAAEVKPRKGGDKPKTTWYGMVDGKVVSVRKVLCPTGFSASKFDATKPETIVPADLSQTTPAVPAAEPAALPQAAV